MRKRRVSQLLILLLICSCTQDTDESSTVQDSSMNIEDNAPRLEFNLDSIKPITQGVWLPKQYVEQIYKTKSPFSASKFIPDIAELQINPSFIKNDSLYITSSLNNHEGYGFNIWFTKPKNTLIINADVGNKTFPTPEIRYNLGADTTLHLIRTKGKIRRIIDYVRVRDKEYITKFSGNGYEYLGRKILLNGIYEIFDSSKATLGIATFDAETGMIDGFKFKYYTIQTDFGSGPQYQGDHVILWLDENHSGIKSYVIQNTTDTLVMYNSKDIISESDYRVVLSNAAYYLIKI